MSGVRPINAWAVIKNNKLNAMDIYNHNNLILDKEEKLVHVIISVDDKKRTTKKRNK